MQRYSSAVFGLNILHCRLNPQISRIAFRRRSNICGSLPQRDPCFRHADELYGLCRIHRYDQRHGIGIAYIF